MACPSQAASQLASLGILVASGAEPGHQILRAVESLREALLGLVHSGASRVLGLIEYLLQSSQTQDHAWLYGMPGDPLRLTPWA